MTGAWHERDIQARRAGPVRRLVGDDLAGRRGTTPGPPQNSESWAPVASSTGTSTLIDGFVAGGLNTPVFRPGNSLADIGSLSVVECDHGRVGARQPVEDAGEPGRVAR